jgi:hypothetical protein
MSAVSIALADTASDSWLETETRRQHSIRSFQRPDKIADAFRLVWPLPLWDAVAADLGRPAADLKTSLDLIIDRRNQIAHEADVDPTTGSRWPISDPDVTTAVDFVEQLVGAFERVI